MEELIIFYKSTKSRHIQRLIVHKGCTKSPFPVTVPRHSVEHKTINALRRSEAHLIARGSCATAAFTTSSSSCHSGGANIRACPLCSTARRTVSFVRLWRGTNWSASPFFLRASAMMLGSSKSSGLTCLSLSPSLCTRWQTSTLFE